VGGDGGEDRKRVGGRLKRQTDPKKQTSSTPTIFGRRKRSDICWKKMKGGEKHTLIRRYVPGGADEMADYGPRREREG